MNLKILKTVGQRIRRNEVYDIYDYNILKSLMISLTELHTGKETNGHKHDDADEVYIFVAGHGSIQIGKDENLCKEGDVFPIPRGSFHKVINAGSKDLVFLCVFEKYEERK